MRADYCPLANEPCQAMCDEPCSAHRLKIKKGEEHMTQPEALRLADVLDIAIAKATGGES